MRRCQDRVGVAAMLAEGRVLPESLRELFEAVAAELYKYRAINPASFRRAPEDALGPL
ncbi:MAG: hypothetical protein LC753_11875 [Acidobacteria bacterium]|nr:hypothetical protein [Acidobacteriota bacterium]MCA1650934.1 hypothetical protein [Acidobacteriota bacterium]